MNLLPPYRLFAMLKAALPLLLIALAARAQPLQAQEIIDPPVRSEDLVGMSDLAALANEEGQVRVIVELATAFHPEGAFQTKGAVQQQRFSIARSQGQVMAQLAPYEPELIAAWKTIPFMAVSVDADGLSALQKSPSVLDIQEDRLDYPLLNGSTVHIGAPKAWAAGYDGSGQTVVLIDSGIDSSHPFFGDRMVAEACFSGNYRLYQGGSPAPDSGVVSLCPNGLTTQIGSSAADALSAECTNGLSGRNRCWHGTHVAGVASGANPGDKNLNGVAKGSGIAAIQVFTHFTTTAACGASADCIASYTSDQISALEYVLTDLHPNHNIAAVNMSLGGTHYSDQALCDAANSARKAAIDNLRAVGIPTIIAAGNSAKRDAIASPACISTAVAVSASVNPSDAIASFASVDEMVELMAPGSKIGSSLPSTYAFGYIETSGTSFAAPHVAGAWAILKDIDPDATVDEILTLLQNTGVPIVDTRSSGTVTKPRVDLCSALTELGVTGSIQLDVKVLLQASFRDIDAGAGFIDGVYMRDTQRQLEVDDGLQGTYLPHSEPYAGQFGFGQGETIVDPGTVLADHGADSIVDWVFIELRDATSPATIFATRAALLQRDGDVVDLDGVSSVLFDCTPPGDYYVAVRHRNHLGAMTAEPISLAAIGTMVDFTDTSVNLWRSDIVYDGHEQSRLNERFMLWAGNANQDAAISYDADGGDPSAVKSAVMGASTNLLGSLGYQCPGYHTEDIDMNGSVVADSAGNEHALILFNVLNHPENPDGILDFIIPEQLAVPSP